LHTDHAGGLSYFPKSEILIHKGEYKGALGFSGLLKGVPNNRFPSRLSPHLFGFNNEKFYSFQQSLKLYDDVIIVPTFGHTGTHISVIVQHDGLNYFLAGDSSYNQQNMLLEKVDGVSLNNGVALTTLKNIKHYAKLNPTIYLPSHDPDSAKRLRNNETVFEHESDVVINQVLT
jgi:N-acyl homoserine lactone hydrolase